MSEDLIREAGEPAYALFLDFDGTLVEIVERPEAVRVDPALPGLLDRLRGQVGGALALVSGRPLAVLDGFLAPFHGDGVGMHGLEYRAAGIDHPCRPDQHPALRRAVGILRDGIGKREGLLIEDKGCSVALHWRLAPAEAEDARNTVTALAAELGPEYRIQFGKAVAEILPADSGKGPAIAKLCGLPPYRGRRPVFIGDDLTDENGFEVVNALGGISVRIGEGETLARHRIPDPAGLRVLLARWADAGRIWFPDRGDAA